MVLNRFRCLLGWLTRTCRIAAYLAQTDSPRLNIGCGKNLLPGWLNTDIDPRAGAVYLNAAKPFPLPANRFKVIFCEHVVEHLTSGEISQFLHECLRVLIPHGVVRIATPDVEFFMRMVANPDTPEAQKYLDWFQTRKGSIIGPADIAVLNSIFYEHGHRCLLNYRALAHRLANAGFKNVRREMVGVSTYNELCAVEGHGRIVGDEVNRLETLVAEAIKP